MATLRRPHGAKWTAQVVPLVVRAVCFKVFRHLALCTEVWPPHCYRRKQAKHENLEWFMFVYSHFVPETDQDAADAFGRIFEEAAQADLLSAPDLDSP